MFMRFSISGSVEEGRAERTGRSRPPRAGRRPRPAPDQGLRRHIDRLSGARSPVTGCRPPTIASV